MSAGAAIRSKFAAFHGNGDISIWVKNSRVEQKRTNKSSYIDLAPTPNVSTGYNFNFTRLVTFSSKYKRKEQ